MSTASPIELPRGGGAIKGIGETFQANLFSGTGNHSIPIALSPGRSGFGPKLSLIYSSGHGNGIFGLGWQLSLPRIARKTEKGLPRYGDDDTFVLSGAEDLVRCLEQVADPLSGDVSWVPADPVVRSGFEVFAYRPRTEGLFARIERWVQIGTGQTHWRTIGKDNITSLFGNTTGSRLADPADPRRVSEWLLSETFDALGNHSRCEYAADDPALYAQRGAGALPETFERRRSATQAYIRRIFYGNLPNPLVDAQGKPVTYPDGTAVGCLRSGRRYAFEVVFDYGDWDTPTVVPHPPPLPEDRQELFGPDPQTSSSGRAVPVRADRFSSFRAGFEVRTLRRCRRVLMFHHFAELGAPMLVRSTDFNYATDPDTQASLLIGATVTGHERDAQGEYRSVSMPPVEFSYAAFRPQEQRFQSLTALGAQMPPLALNDPRMALVDLFGDGLPDIVHSGPEGFRCWRNLGNGVLDRPRTLEQMPASISLDQAGIGFGDMSGNGITDLLVNTGPLPGFFETTADGAWRRFTPYFAVPAFAPHDPNVRMIDLTGDGRTDALMTRDEQFLWFECLGEIGFAAPRAIARIHDLDEFPDVQFDDPSGRVRLADMNGDGLNDIVVLHAGRIDYWPNLGYGRFGKRVSMAAAPRLDGDIDPARLFLADLNGTGCADLVVVGSRRVDFWFNRNGNAWSERQTIRGTPDVDDASALAFTDIHGSGTTALLWSRDRGDAPGAAGAHYAALDFCGGVKPYVLEAMDNNLGATTRVRYAPSTRYFLEDQANGRPWIAPLPFPVQVVDKVEVIDHVSKSKRVSTYKYHHGHYDGREREFCGFARVDRFDTEAFEVFSHAGLHGEGVAFAKHDPAHHLPPVETRSWFHPGLALDDRGLGSTDPRDLGEKLRAEYYRLDPQAVPMDAHDVSTGDTPHAAFRALRGAELRTEVYAHDGSVRAEHPYQVSESRYRVMQLQPRHGKQAAVYFTHVLESLHYDYERRPADPRIGHQLTLEVDAFGQPLKTLAIGYGRRQPDPGLPTDADRERQTRTLITYTDNRCTHAIDDPRAHPDTHRAPAPCEKLSWELTGFAPTDPGAQRFSHAEWVADDLVRIKNAHAIDYEAQPDPAVAQKRLIEHARTRYRSNDLAGLLPLGVIESLALPGESCKLAFTQGLLARIYGARVGDADLIEAGYVRGDDGRGWWVPSGRTFHSPSTADTPAEELRWAQDHFFAACRAVDPFGNTTVMASDPYVLLIGESTDALGNRTHAEHDYRVLQARRITDPNGNRTEVVFDTLGLVAGSAVMGKAGQTQGDSLEGFSANLTASQRAAFLADPLAQAALLLGSASTRIVHDLERWRRDGQPVCAAVITRETHAGEPQPEGGSKLHLAFGYSDGFGREIQKKLSAEPDPHARWRSPPPEGAGPPSDRPGGGPGQLVEGGPSIASRWVGSGWTIFNNKGKPVQQFEPFFDDTHGFRSDQRAGVSATLFYDPLTRVVATLHPDHTWEKVVFDPWLETRWDRNDTVLIDDPRADADTGGFFRALAVDDFLPTWHAARIGGERGATEQAAAARTAMHAGTPAQIHADALGRRFLTIAHNRFERDGAVVEEAVANRVLLDIEGNEREAIDANGRVATRLDFDMLGNRSRQTSMEAGERWMFNDVAGQAVLAWDSRGQRFRNTYDALRRPLALYLQEGSAAEQLIGRTIFGESVANAEALNLRGKAYQQFDQAGVVTHDAYDFKGNLLSARRRLARNYQTTLDWSAAPELEINEFVSSTAYDALNRPVAVTAPDGSITQPQFNAAGLLTSLEVKLRGATDAKRFVSQVDYDAKGRRVAIVYGNGVRTQYSHDPLTLRLERCRTLRGTEALQDLTYTHDPVGNVMHIGDGAQQTLYFDNQVVTPNADYGYDALYRLLDAEGREHIGQASQPEPTWSDAARTQLPHPHDGKAMRRYAERYVYDPAGNLLELVHKAADGNWTRRYRYAEASLIEPNRSSNRSSDTTVGNREPERYAYDAHGNMTAMPHLARMSWTFNDQLRRVDLGGGGTAWYVYDAGGQRVRKVVEKNAGNLIEERITLGGFEVFRRRNATAKVALERETLHVMDDRRRIALVDTRTQGEEPELPAQSVRYQLGNHLGSATLELDEAGRIVSYEEYYPHGSTSYQAGRSMAEVSLKRWRYTGMERDEETGLSLHGARYYAPWLGRWTAADPRGLGADGSNLYAYVANNPIGRVDPSGFESEKAPTAEHQWGIDAADNNNRHDRLMGLTKLLGEHGYAKGRITDLLAKFGDDKVLAHYGYTAPGRFEKGPAFQARVRQAILGYDLAWQAQHGGNHARMGPVSAEHDVAAQRRAFEAVWLEGQSYVVGSFLGAATAGVAQWFTDDPVKVTAAAGMGAAAQGVVGSFAAAGANKGSHSPGVVNEPAAAMYRRVMANSAARQDAKAGAAEPALLAHRKARLAQLKQANAAIRDSIKDVNPSGCLTNCSWVAAAVEATRAGRPTQAPASTETWPYDAGMTAMPVQMSSIRDVVAAMRSLGPGARGYVVGERANTSGHAFNVENSGGSILFLEGQVGNGQCPAKVGPTQGFTSFEFRITN